MRKIRFKGIEKLVKSMSQYVNLDILDLKDQILSHYTTLYSHLSQRFIPSLLKFSLFLMLPNSSGFFFFLNLLCFFFLCIFSFISISCPYNVHVLQDSVFNLSLFLLYKPFWTISSQLLYFIYSLRIQLLGICQGLSSLFSFCVVLLFLPILILKRASTKWWYNESKKSNSCFWISEWSPEK